MKFFLGLDRKVKVVYKISAKNKDDVIDYIYNNPNIYVSGSSIKENDLDFIIGNVFETNCYTKNIIDLSAYKRTDDKPNQYLILLIGDKYKILQRHELPFGGKTFDKHLKLEPVMFESKEAAREYIKTYMPDTSYCYDSFKTISIDVKNKLYYIRSNLLDARKVSSSGRIWIPISFYSSEGVKSFISKCLPMYKHIGTTIPKAILADFEDEAFAEPVIEPKVDKAAIVTFETKETHRVEEAANNDNIADILKRLEKTSKETTTIEAKEPNKDEAITVDGPIPKVTTIPKTISKDDKFRVLYDEKYQLYKIVESCNIPYEVLNSKTNYTNSEVTVISKPFKNKANAILYSNIHYSRAHEIGSHRYFIALDRLTDKYTIFTSSDKDRETVKNTVTLKTQPGGYSYLCEAEWKATLDGKGFTVMGGTPTLSLSQINEKAKEDIKELISSKPKFMAICYKNYKKRGKNRYQIIDISDVPFLANITENVEIIKNVTLVGKVFNSKEKAQDEYKAGCTEIKDGTFICIYSEKKNMAKGVSPKNVEKYIRQDPSYIEVKKIRFLDACDALRFGNKLLELKKDFAVNKEKSKIKGTNYNALGNLDPDALCKFFNTKKEGAVFIDGSYMPTTKKISYACVFFFDGKRQKDAQEITMYNTLSSTEAELYAAMKAVSMAHMHGCKKLHVYYDCAAVVDAITSIEAKHSEYKKCMLTYMAQMKIEFHKVAAHSGVCVNSLCDKLAREALSNNKT